MDNVQFAEIMKARTKGLAIRIIKLFQSLPKTEEARIIGKQLLRCSTSVAANYRAVCRARSNAEYYAKVCITVEEADETLFWLEILAESNIIAETKLTLLQQEVSEILAIVSKTKRSMKRKILQLKSQQLNNSTTQ